MPVFFFDITQDVEERWLHSVAVESMFSETQHKAAVSVWADEYFTPLAKTHLPVAWTYSDRGEMKSTYWPEQTHASLYCLYNINKIPLVISTNNNSYFVSLHVL